VFFNGLDAHAQLEGNDPNLVTLSTEIKSNFTDPNYYTLGYAFNQLKLTDYPMDFKIDNKVVTNTETSNALTISAKTDSINKNLKADKKIKDQTKYSKILI
jgi:hypothetical protein